MDKSRLILIIFTSVLAVIVMAAACGNCGGRRSGRNRDKAPARYARDEPNTDRSVMSGTEIFKRYNEAVFMVYTADDEQIHQGSGFFIGKKGLAVSNYHVFQGTERGAEAIKLAGSDEAYHVTDVVAYSAEDDYILFHVNVTGNKYLPVSWKKPKVGQQVYAIGSPQGLENTFSDGKVSAIRSESLIQISVPIDHGSSGGALINRYGEAIGITTAGLDDSNANLNFAISIRMLMPYIDK